MTRDQRIVAIGAASGVLAMVVSVVTLSQLLPVNSGPVDASSRIGYALQMNAFAVLPLLISVGLTYSVAESGVVITASRASGDVLGPGASVPFTVSTSGGTPTPLGATSRKGHGSGGTFDLPL